MNNATAIAPAFEIGQKVKWSISDKTRRGMFMQDLEDGTCECMCIEFEGVKMAMKAMVPAELLEMDNN